MNFHKIKESLHKNKKKEGDKKTKGPKIDVNSLSNKEDEYRMDVSLNIPPIKNEETKEGYKSLSW